ncbi:MAG: sulfurtransferase [Vicingaceae bacterium]|jgi:rhodanese-related sulfurtransferase|nr:MAG: sulfurtransferase [Vicingaceae bacterium]
MKKIFVQSAVLIMGIFILQLTACGQKNSSEVSAVVENVSAQDFYKKMKDKDVVVVDVRTPMETKQGKIPGALEIDFYADDFKEQINRLDKNKTVMVYCRSGGRSAKAAEIMKEMGFKKIVNLENGFMEWQKQNLPVE